MTIDISFWNRKKTGFGKIKIEVVVWYVCTTILYFFAQITSGIQCKPILPWDYFKHMHTHTHSL